MWGGRDTGGVVNSLQGVLPVAVDLKETSKNSIHKESTWRNGGDEEEEHCALCGISLTPCEVIVPSLNVGKMDVVLQALRCPQCPVETMEVQQESNPSGFNITTTDAIGMDDPKLTQMTPRVVLHLLEDTMKRSFFGSESPSPQTIRRRYSSRLRFKRDPPSYPTKNNSKSSETQVPKNKKQINESPNLHLPFTCSFCSCTFKNTLSHDRHVRLAHTALTGPKSPKSKKHKRAKTDKHAEKIRANVSVYCNLCRINFNGDMEALQVHLKSPQHLREVDSLKNVDTSKYCVPCKLHFDNKKTHIKTFRHIKAILFRNHVIPEDTFDVPVKCHACPSVFELRSDLEGHIERNHTEYSCEFCGAKFTHCEEFHAHCQRTHEVPKPFICSECGKKFEKRWNLISHKKFVHEGDPSVCAFCSKTFPTPHSMKNHVYKIHQREKSRIGFSICQFCPKEEFFAKKLALRKHLLDVHRAKYLQMGSLLPCKICYHVFPREGEELKVHMASHANLQCKTCGRYLATLLCLKMHMMIHTGEKPYDCPHCEKKCRRKGDLKGHIWSKHVKKVKLLSGSTTPHQQQAAFH